MRLRKPAILAAALLLALTFSLPALGGPAERAKRARARARAAMGLPVAPAALERRIAERRGLSLAEDDAEAVAEELPLDVEIEIEGESLIEDVPPTPRRTAKPPAPADDEAPVLLG